MRIAPYLLTAILTPAAVHAQAIVITPQQAHATVGDTVRFKAVARDARGNVVDTARIMFNAAPFDVAWALPDGRIVPVRQGEVQVFAIWGGQVARAVLNVSPKGPASVDLESTSPRLVPGGFATLSATARTSDGENLRDARITFTSSNPRVATVDAGGVVSALAPGSVSITSSTGNVRNQISLEVVPNTVARLDITGPATARTGDVVVFNARPLDAQGGALRSVPVRWTVNGESADVFPDGGFVAERAGSYLVSAVVGKVIASRAIMVSPRVHVRKLERVSAHIMSDFQAAENWAVGNALYVTTIGDRMYTFDITNPGAPVLTDSLIVDAHTINDIQTTPDGRIGVLTREGASSRKNGIVFLDLSSALHPKVASEYTATVTGGVHSVFIDSHYVYLTDDATGSMRVIDFADVAKPREVARWSVPGIVGAAGMKDPVTGDVLGGTVGRMLHDLQVKDGLAYLAYWRHGVVILDVGAGIKGGSPSDPKLVSQHTYNVADYYPADRIAGTHTVFRYKSYLFVGDEVFPAVFNIADRGRIEALGQIHVFDVSDITKPRRVAEYKHPGGSHNVWVDDDVLYLGAYEGGLRALDVSGELRGDLMAQGREIGAVWTADPKGYRPNLPMAWGAQPHRGFIYTTDINSGLWVARLTPRVTF